MSTELTPEELLAPYPPTVRAIATDLRASICREFPEVEEVVLPGSGVIGYLLPCGESTRQFGFLAPYEDRVVLGFEWGALMDDPFGLLEGDGKRVRNIVCRRHRAADCSKLRPYIRQATELATSRH